MFPSLGDFVQCMEVCGSCLVGHPTWVRNVRRDMSVQVVKSWWRSLVCDLRGLLEHDRLRSQRRPQSWWFGSSVSDHVGAVQSGCVVMVVLVAWCM